MLHVNIRKLQKKFDSFCNLSIKLKFELKVTCITETLCLDNSINQNLYKLKTAKGGGIAVFFHESLTSNIRNDLSIHSGDIETRFVRVINKMSKNIFINTQYSQPAENFNKFESYLNTFLAKCKTAD